MRKEYTLLRRKESWSRSDEEVHWEEIPVLQIDTRLWTPPVDIQAWAQLCYDPGRLYVRLCAREADIRAEHTSPTGMPCEDSCLEFFLSPDGTRYINIECNPNGCLYLGIGKSGKELYRLLPEQNVLNPQTARTTDGWQTTYQVPLAFLQMFFPDFRLEPGVRFRANCYKCGDLTPQPHFFSWNPVTSETPDFHRLCDFGEMVLQLP